MTSRGCRFSTSSDGARSIRLSVIRRERRGSRGCRRRSEALSHHAMLSRNGIRPPQVAELFA